MSRRAPSQPAGTLAALVLALAVGSAPSVARAQGAPPPGSTAAPARPPPLPLPAAQPAAADDDRASIEDYLGEGHPPAPAPQVAPREGTVRTATKSSPVSPRAWSRTLVRAGAGTLISVWLGTVINGALIQHYENDLAKLGQSLVCPQILQNGGRSTSSCLQQDGYDPVYIPIVGPFIALGTGHSPPSFAVTLVALGGGQIAGLAMLVTGLAAGGAAPRRDEIDEAPRPRVVPLVGLGTLGLAGTF